METVVGLRIEEQETSWLEAQPHQFADGDRCLIGDPGGDDPWREVDIDDLGAIGDAGLEMADSPRRRAVAEQRCQMDVLGADAEKDLLPTLQRMPPGTEKDLQVPLTHQSL